MSNYFDCPGVGPINLADPIYPGCPYLWSIALRGDTPYPTLSAIPLRVIRIAGELHGLDSEVRNRLQIIRWYSSKPEDPVLPEGWGADMGHGGTVVAWSSHLTTSVRERLLAQFHGRSRKEGTLIQLSISELPPLDKPKKGGRPKTK